MPYFLLLSRTPGVVSHLGTYDITRSLGYNPTVPGSGIESKERKLIIRRRRLWRCLQTNNAKI